MTDFKNLDNANASYDHLKKLYKSSGTANEDLKIEIDRLIYDNEIMRQKLINCDKSNQIVKETMRIAIEDFNNRIQAYITEIQSLEAQIRK